ncbi:Methyltransferase type 12 [plant metagenome]|uniref:Methyltransferase type 12 n=1 Tax=plant metagenome TaxID=1297885 RepID=A0A484V306_9ZZZZ
MTSDAAYFDQLYRADADPWQVQSRWYEQRKRAVLLASLRQETYRNAFEPGCGTGELSAALAPRCQALLACDFAPQAAGLAAARTADWPHVRVQTRSLPAQWPADTEKTYDLIVVSELAYYLDAADLARFIERCVASLAPEGELLACHWRHDFHDRRQATHAVHAAYDCHPALTRLARHEDPDFLLQTWHHTPAGPTKETP